MLLKIFCFLAHITFACAEWNSTAFQPSDFSQTDFLLFVGASFPFSGGWAVGFDVQPALDMALQKVNEDFPATVVGIWADSRCLANFGLANFVSMVKDKRVQAVIGDGCSVACEPMGSLGGIWGTPQISWGCSSPILSDKARFPFFIRTSLHESMKIDFYIALFKHFNWKRCATLTADIPLTAAFMDEFSLKVRAAGIEVVLSEVHKLDEPPLLQLERIKERAVSGRILFPHSPLSPFPPLPPLQ